MNKELILKVADEIEAMPHVEVDDFYNFASGGFSMDSWRDTALDGGTVSSVGGHISKLDNLASWAVADALGISTNEAAELCYPSTTNDWRSILPSQAAAVLRHLAETEQVDWSIASPTS